MDHFDVVTDYYVHNNQQIFVFFYKQKITSIDQFIMTDYHGSEYTGSISISFSSENNGQISCFSFSSPSTVRQGSKGLPVTIRGYISLNAANALI